ncbi:DEAD/DEAH box helicase [uncultured Eubacterium sp.]|jgi:SNF2 family DNA or RNA helicase|uniref:SNF2-related protein n=1 Tax=uncultured Eubacterium sp. TaxID=165185 RepID=UPI002630EBBC|nr:DEAD/DEAH box helicase [uncultured Eubacterium sp.]
MTDFSLMPHQETALDLTADRNRCAYYLDMGLGKTFVGAEKVYLLNNDVNIVVCQKSKIDDWIEHFQEYYPDYSVFNLTKKNQAVRFKELVETDKFYDYDIQIVGVINYDLVFRRSYISHIRNFTLLLDESSLICNENAKRSKFILKLNPESVVLLSGTPTAGKYERLWSQLHLLGWEISKKAFWKSYVETEWIETGDFKQEVVVGYKNVNHLKKKLAQYGAVFMKTGEVMNLPEQIEQKIFLKTTKEYHYFVKNSYLLLDTLNLCQFKDDSDFQGEDVTPRIELVGDNSLTKTLYARQLCGQYHKEKLEAFRDLLESTEDRVIVFYNFNEELNRLKKVCESLNREISFVNGSGMSMYAYEEIPNSVLFVQYQAGAMGGNFQKANKIIYYTLPLGKGSCDLWEQSKKRIHRIGQKRTCFYYYLLVKGSFEEKNFAALQEGKELTDELFKDCT